MTDMEMDVASFIERNGREFFDCRQAPDPVDTVTIVDGVPISTQGMKELRFYSRVMGVSVQEFIARIIEGWLRDC